MKSVKLERASSTDRYGLNRNNNEAPVATPVIVARKSPTREDKPDDINIQPVTEWSGSDLNKCF